MTLKALIFDVDGTLAETDDVKRAAFNQAFAEFGLDWVWDRAVYAQIRANTRPGNEMEFYTLMRHPAQFSRLERNGFLTMIPDRQQEIYLNLLEAGAAPLRPGVARLIGDAISGNLKIALCSTGRRVEFETLLFNRFGLEMVDRLSCSTALENLNNPSPLLAYRDCIARLGVPASQIIAIDDSGPGVAAAASLGLRVIVTPSAYTLRDNFPGAQLVISDLGHPAAPFSVLKGKATGVGYVGLRQLHRWHRDEPAAVSDAA